MTLIRINPQGRRRREFRAAALALLPAVGLGAGAAALGSEAAADQPLGSSVLVLALASAAGTVASALVARAPGLRRAFGLPDGTAPEWFAYLPAVAAALAAGAGAMVGTALAQGDGPRALGALVPLVIGALGSGLFRPRRQTAPALPEPLTTSGRVIRIGPRPAPPPLDGDDDLDPAGSTPGGVTIRSPQQTTCAGCKSSIGPRDPVSLCSGPTRHKVHTQCASVLCNNKCPECGHRVA